MHLLVRQVLAIIWRGWVAHIQEDSLELGQVVLPDSEYELMHVGIGSDRSSSEVFAVVPNTVHGERRARMARNQSCSDDRK